MPSARRLRIYAATLRVVMIAALSASPLPAQTDFTGTITFLMHSKSGRSQTMVQTIKGKRLRMDMHAQGESKDRGATIFDGVARTTTMLLPDKRMYIVISADNVKSAGAQAAAMNPPRSTPRSVPKDKGDVANVKVTNTGRTERVAGVSCDVYRVSGTTEGNTRVSEVCLGKGVGFAPMQMAAGMMMSQPAAAAPDMSDFGDLLKENRGVLKVTSFENGKPFVEMEATSVDRSVPDEAMFAVPPGYTRFQMPAMPDLRGLNKRPPQK